MTTCLETSGSSATFPDMGDLCGAAEIGALLGVSRQRVQQLANRDDFPKPLAELAMGKVWATADVRAWAAARGRQLND